MGRYMQKHLHPLNCIPQFHRQLTDGPHTGCWVASVNPPSSDYVIGLMIDEQLALARAGQRILILGPEPSSQVWTTLMNTLSTDPNSVTTPRTTHGHTP